MTNDIGKLTVYKEDDTNKKKYINDINIGDILFFHKESKNDNTPLPTNRYPGHVGLYIGDNKFIHSSPDEGKIVITELTDYWLKPLVGTRDILTGILNKQKKI